MKQLKLPAVFMRGGTSNAVVFNQRNLPQDRALWDEIFLAAIGSPDPNGRQLDGMGGGVSSLSKVCVVGPPTRADADIDYTFAQVQVKEAKVDYGANCGNMSSAMGRSRWMKAWSGFRAARRWYASTTPTPKKSYTRCSASTMAWPQSTVIWQFPAFPGPALR